MAPISGGNVAVAGGFAWVETKTVAGAAVLTLDLDHTMDAAYCYQLRCFLLNSNASIVNYSLRLNGADAQGPRQYGSNQGVVEGGNAGVSTLNLSTGFQSQQTYIEILLPNLTADGQKRFAHCVPTIESISATPTYGWRHTGFEITTPSISTAVTSCGIGASSSDGIGIGSFIELYRQKRS